MEPIVNGLEAEFEAEVTFVRLDAGVPGNARIQQGYGLRGHPTFVLLDADNQVVTTFVGPQPAESLRQALGKIAEQEN